MPAVPFDVNVRQQPRAAIIDLHGEINAGAEARLNDAYEQADRGDPEVILLNFSQVIYMNSTGIALIVGLLARARKHKRRIIACGLSQHFRDIFEITRLSDFMPVFNDEVGALSKAEQAEHVHVRQSEARGKA
ncbi:MAG: STAS domain-containing protein [Roseiflexaceae bacterium]|nr:STAS domain-containing protein [Roseiflexaceae bacterium]